MKISVDLSVEELKEITRVTGISKKGPAIRKLLVDALQMQRRAEISAKFLSGEWSVELADFEKSKSIGQSHDSNLATAWR